jgi:large subunit ribosomal protein L19e
MSNLSTQKRLAADVLDVGKNRVWFDPGRQGDIAEAITRDDIRDLVEEGAIRSSEARGNSKGRARERKKKRAYGHRKGAGSRRGKAGGRQDPKDDWQERIRAQRERLRALRDSGEITAEQYRQMYAKATGGEFRSVERMMTYIENNYGEA